jgi:hypothetical protein
MQATGALLDRLPTAAAGPRRRRACRPFAPTLRLALQATMLTAAVMPFVPDEISVFSVCFTLSAIMLLIFGLVRRLQLGWQVADSSAAALVVFLLLAFASGGTRLDHNVTTAQWTRAVIPFLFLGAYLLLAPIRCETDARRLVNLLHLSAVVWAVKILIIVAPDIPAVVTGQIERLTYLTLDLTLPYGLVGLVLSIFNPDPRWRRHRRLLVVLFLGLIIGTGYRMQAFIAVMVVAANAVRFRRRALATLAVGALAGLVLINGASDSEFVDRYLARFRNLKTERESSRVSELRYAWTNFLEAPVVGKGLGFQIPTEVTAGGNFEFIRTEIRRESVGYMHNLVGYLLMDLGVTGTLAYLGMLALAARTRWRERKAGGLSDLDFGLLVLVVALLMFFCSSASFRLIQSNLLIAGLMAVLTRRTGGCLHLAPRYRIVQVKP